MNDVVERVADAIKSAIGMICDPNGMIADDGDERIMAASRAAIAAYEAAVGNLINIDQVAISRAMAICGFGGAVLDAARIAEALHGLIPAAPSARIAALEEALQDAVLQIEYLHGKF